MEFIQRLDLMRFEKYNNVITRDIDSKMNKENNEINIKLLRTLTGNVKSNWKDNEKNLKIKNCPICLKRWEKQLIHIMRQCEEIKKKFINHRISSEEKQILSIEYMKTILKIIVSNELDIEI